MFLRHPESVRPYLSGTIFVGQYIPMFGVAPRSKRPVGGRVSHQNRRSMDIQKMVDERIEQLIAQSEKSSLAPKHHEGISSDDLSDLGNAIDAAMMEVAERVLAISDRVAGDFARMEKDILDSRLSVLQSAEAVLDIAVSLSRKAKALTSAYVNTARQRPIEDDELRLVRAVRDLEDSCLQDGRASMHDHGVASLFRRT